MKENRWYIYQKERFPILMYFPMILAFSFSAVSYSSLLRAGRINPLAVVVSFITTFTTFMLLRIADEHKDYEEDCRYRPYRPVPRGLVTLRELFYIGAALMVVQFVAALLLYPMLLPLLFVVWVYYGAMTMEFFVPEWLKRHMFIYMFSHMLVMPLLDMYAAACDFLPTMGYAFIPSMLWFVLSSFCDGVVVEVCRKMRAPEDEEEGVSTYSAMWGRGRSAAVVLVSMTLSLLSTAMATGMVGCAHISTPILGVVAALCAIPILRYVKTPTTKNSKLLELLSGVWTIADYTCLGVLPLIYLTVAG